MTKDVGREFMQKTRYQFLEPSDQARGIPQPPLELPYDQSSRRVCLPTIDVINTAGTTLRDAISARRSVREYDDQPLRLEELSFLLWTTQGITQIIPGRATLRTVPSAGARHALETFILAQRVLGVTPGLYRYVASEHVLSVLDETADLGQRAVGACLGQQFVGSSAAVFIWAAVPYRMTWRYGQRGYRYLHLDAGHVGQNLYLAAESLGCGVCAIAAFDDEALNRMIGANGEEIFVIYVATIGYPRR